jgi:hypothetical protein
LRTGGLGTEAPVGGIRRTELDGNSESERKGNATATNNERTVNPRLELSIGLETEARVVPGRRGNYESSTTEGHAA